MELGVLYDLRNPPSSGISNAEIYAETLEHIEAMEALGFDVVWLTEHHFIDDSYLPATLTMAAAVAARTERVTIGTAVLLLPLHDPLKVAEEAAVVDLLSGGRLRLGLGLGYKLQEFDVFGVDRRHRRGLMEEGVEVIRRAWADGPFTYEGRHHQLPRPGRDTEARAAPRPGDLARRPRPGAGRAGRPAGRRADRHTRARHLRRRTSRPGQRLGRTGSNNLCTFAFTYPTDDPERAVAELGSYAAYRMALTASGTGRPPTWPSTRGCAGWVPARARCRSRASSQRPPRSPASSRTWPPSASTACCGSPRCRGRARRPRSRSSRP